MVMRFSPTQKHILNYYYVAACIIFEHVIAKKIHSYLCGYSGFDTRFERIQKTGRKSETFDVEVFFQVGCFNE